MFKKLILKFNYGEDIYSPKLESFEFEDLQVNYLEGFFFYLGGILYQRDKQGLSDHVANVKLPK